MLITNISADVVKNESPYQQGRLQNPEERKIWTAQIMNDYKMWTLQKK